MGATIGTKLHTFLNGKLVGEDEFGNKYYIDKKCPSDKEAKRWVIYNGSAEPSKIPAMWHGWLHYNVAEVPTDKEIKLYDWQKTHQPNLTGTKNAYLPKGNLRNGGERAASSSDYESWSPNS